MTVGGAAKFSGAVVENAELEHGIRAALMIASKQMTLSPAQHFDCHIMGLTLSVAASSARALVDPALAVRPKSERRPRRRAAAGVTERLRPAAHAMLSSPATRMRLDRDVMTPLGPDSRIELQRAARSSQRRGSLAL